MDGRPTRACRAVGGLVTIGLTQLACLDALTFGFPNADFVSFADTVVGSLGSGQRVDYPITNPRPIHVSFFVQASDGSEGSVVLELFPGVEGARSREGSSGVLSTASSDAGDIELLDEGSGPRVVDDGAFRIRITSRNYKGSYRFYAFPLDSAVEGGVTAVEMGGEVADEIFPPADVDTFTLTAAPGSEFNTLIERSSGVERLGIQFGSSPPSSALPDTTVYVGRVRMANAGSLSVIVTGLNKRTSRGPYRVRFIPIFRAPEGIPATVIVGDTISEMIDPRGDVDEYTLLGVPANGRVIAFLQGMSGSDLDFYSLEFVNPTTGATLGRIVGSRGTDQRLEDHTSGTVTVRNGDVVRVLGLNSSRDRGPYRFTVRAAPP